ncbi:hypothetical protein C0V73_00030 [Rhizobium sp. TH135]|uniref:hypothetical protein n=1 Tax=Rhizobium sp. TH135 TaxID=2067451 RepID=UPI000C795891|nr:hypothetical protein [Rhizobium sp. TH135]PLK72265.1 hypothetical protein C0V73_00030 [Rhizobium sp. TH135]
MKRLALTLALIGAFGAAQAEGVTGNYLCLADAAGGMAYNKETKQWIAGAFDTTRIRSILKIRPGSGPDSYKVTFTDTDLKNDVTCMNIPTTEALISDELICSTYLGSLRFSFETRKFISAYLFSHYNDSTDTLFVAVGSCSKLD